MVALGEVCEVFNGSTPSRENQSYWENGTIPWFTIEDIRRQGRKISTTRQMVTKTALQKTSVKLLPPKTVLLCCAASVGEYAISEIELTTNQQFNGLVINKKSKGLLLSEFLFLLSASFKSELLRMSGKTSFNFVPVRDVRKIKIPLPPLSIQKEIVAEIEGYQEIIDGAKQVVEHWKPTIKIDPKWPMVKLGEVCSLEYGKPLKKEDRKDGEYPVFGSNGIVGYHNEYLVEGPFVIVGRKGTAGMVNYSEQNGFPIDTTFYVHLKEKMCLKFLYYAMKSLSLGLINQQSSVPGLNRNDAYKAKIPLPPLDIQKEIIAEIEEERKSVESCKWIIEKSENKIKKSIDKIWTQG